ncbi:MAG: amidohydrolase family protein [Euzebyaceae bacterium]|jgi:predicted TIM-barrel fold metal-dependent hydrolase|nr:amidohydrolase family protein [Euzebyaceae bacterium]
MAAPLDFVDTHHHLWDLGRFHYDWLSGEGWPGHTALLGDYSSIRRDYLVEELLAEFATANVVKSVHVEAAYAGPDPVEETEWLQQVAEEHGFPHALVVFCDIEAEDADAQLDRHCACDNVRGVRIRAHPDDVTDPAFRTAFAALGRRNLSYEQNASPGNLVSGRDLARDFPNTQIILGHTGFPLERTDEYFQRWRTEMAELAEAPNVAVKISGLGMVDNAWTVDSIRPWVLSTVEIFGVDRCMFGTNWPVDKLFSTYADLVAAYAEIIADFSRDEQEQLFSRNAERYYRI